MKQLKKRLKKIIRKLLPRGVEASIISDFRKTSKGHVYYSQEGEDMILNRIFGNKQSGFYIDVGAHHPTRFSNTYLFYLKGWCGINIDAMPGSMKAFNQLRPKDINLEIPISETIDTLVYYSFNEPALNTFSKEEAQKKDGLRNYKIVEEIPLVTQPLSQVIRTHIPANQEIDFLSIDVEGLDFMVLKSNDWSVHRPKVVLIEDLNKNIDEIIQGQVYQFMKDKDYAFFAKSYNTLFFIDNNWTSH